MMKKIKKVIDLIEFIFGACIGIVLYIPTIIAATLAIILKPLNPSKMKIFWIKVFCINTYVVLLLLYPFKHGQFSNDLYDLLKEELAGDKDIIREMEALWES